MTLGISVDSVFSHGNWGASIGGISFPLLSDFNPKGKVAQSFGVYNEERGITFRATVLIDAGGTIRHIETVSSGRDMAALAAQCEAINNDYAGNTGGLPAAPGISGDPVLYVKNQCGPSRATLIARENLHLQSRIAVHNVDEDAAAKSRLEALSGSAQAPCLVVDGKPMLEAGDIVRHLVTQATGFWP